MISMRMRVARWAAVPVMAVILTFAAAASAANCPTTPPTINLKFATPEPAIDNSLPQPALQRVADAASTQKHEGHTLGLYVSKLRYARQLEFKVTSMGGGACVSVSAVNMTWELLERRIYVTAEYKSGTCPYTAILAHERKHQATDERVLRERSTPAKRRIIDAVTRAAAPIPSPRVEAERDRLIKLMDETAAKILADLSAQLKSAQLSVDAGREYQRVAESCTQFRRPV